MNLKVENIMNIMEKYAPPVLKEDYDNVGLMVGDPESEVTSILVALDCTLEVIQEAIECNCNLILTHHPLLFKKPSTVTTETLLGKKILKIIRNNLNVYSSHTNLDSVSEGIADKLMAILEFESYSIIECADGSKGDFKNSGIGRIACLKKPMRFEEFCLSVKRTLHISSLRYCGNDSMMIDKIAVINGSGQDYFSKALKMGAQCIVTGDTTYHYMSDLNEQGIAVIDAGHFETEWPAMKQIASVIQSKINKAGYTNKVIISKNAKSPYKFI